MSDTAFRDEVCACSSRWAPITEDAGRGSCCFYRPDRKSSFVSSKAEPSPLSHTDRNINNAVRAMRTPHRELSVFAALTGHVSSSPFVSGVELQLFLSVRRC